MFGRRKRRMALDNGMLSTLKRGADPNAPALAAQEAFPTAEMIAADHNLAFDMSNAEGKMFLGLVGGEMKIKDGTLAAHGGHLVGIHDDRHFMIVAGSRAGKGSVSWNGKNEMGQNVSGGIYLFTIETPSFSKTKKMILLK